MNDVYAESISIKRPSLIDVFLNNLALRLFTFFKTILLLVLFSTITQAAGQAVQELDDSVSEVEGKINILQSDQNVAIRQYQYRLDSINASTGTIIVAGVRSVRIGQIVTLPITLIPSAFKVSAFQGDILLPTGFSLVSFSTGAVVSSSGKSISMSPITGGWRFLIFGINQTILTESLITNLRIRVDSTVIPNLYPISISNPSASDPNGNYQILSTISGTVVVKP